MRMFMHNLIFFIAHDEIQNVHTGRSGNDNFNQKEQLMFILRSINFEYLCMLDFLLLISYRQIK